MTERERFSETGQNALKPRPVDRRRGGSRHGSRRGPERPQSRIELTVSTLLGTVVALAPFPFGSTDPSILTLWCSIIGLGLILAGFIPIGRAQGRMLLMIVGVLCCIVVVVAIQLSGGGGIIAPHPLWAQASAVLGQHLAPSVAVVSREPFYAAGPTLAFVGTLSLAIIVGSHRRGAEQILRVVTWSGLGYAVYGIGAALATPTMVLWKERQGYSGNVTGTFLQRNTAATYFGVVTLVWFIRLVQELRKALPPGQFTWSRFNSEVLNNLTRPLAIPFVAAFLCFMALFMTGSRAGTVLSLFAITGAVLTMFWRDLPRTGLRTRALAGAGVVALIVLQVFGGIVSNRFNASGFDDEGRLAVQGAAVRIVADHPWFGTGLGTFPWIFPSYRPMPPEMFGTYERVFCTPLEMASELGLPVMVVVTFAVVGTLLMLARRLAEAGDRRPVILAALLTALLALIHSTIDYPLQIPGFALVAAAVVGSGVSQALSLRRRRHAGPVANSSGAAISPG